MEEQNYSATLTIASSGDSPHVDIQIQFDPPLKEGDEIPVAYQFMEYVCQNTVFPLAALGEEMATPVSETVN